MKLKVKICNDVKDAEDFPAFSPHIVILQSNLVFGEVKYKEM